MDPWFEKLMNLSEEEVVFLDSFMQLPKEIQDLYRLWIMGDPEQSLEAEIAIYDLLEQQGHDVSSFRESMKERLNDTDV